MGDVWRMDGGVGGGRMSIYILHVRWNIDIRI